MKRNSILLCLLFAIAANSFTAAKAQVNVNDSLALVDLYNSTDGPNWIKHTNWLTLNPVSTWFGVEVAGSRVVRISLNSNKLNGALPATIGNLSFLTYLSLYNNRLSGELPAAISNIDSLEELHLATNNLTGSIPAAIGNLKQLATLDFNRNRFTGAIPASLSNLTSLKNLDLSINYLEDSIPADLFTLTNLKTLDLSGNKLSGTISEAIGNLTNLIFCNLGRNKFIGKIPGSMGKLVHLADLVLSYNSLTGSIPYSFKNLTDLSSLNVSYNHLTQKNNVNFPYFKESSIQLSLYNNRFTFDGLEFVAEKVQPYAYYGSQARINIHQNGNTLSVYAGGTLSNNTYNWFKAGIAGSTTIKGDSTFTPTSSGKYYAKVTNAIATQLTLYTDTITYTMALAQTQHNVANVAAVKAFTNQFVIYPNPVNDIIHIQVNGKATITLSNSAGTILLTKAINNNDVINVSKYANGTYYIQNKITGEVQKMVIVH